MPKNVITVLLADDSESNLRIAKGLLDKHGFEVVIAWNGYEASELAKALHFDLVLMDLQMPEMDGLEAAAIIKTARPELPVIAVTANTSTEDRERCLQLGMEAFVAKPYREKDLMDAICKVLALDPADYPVASLADFATGKTSGLFSLKTIIEYGGGKSDFVSELKGIFIDDLEKGTHNMSKAVLDGDLDTVKDIAHRLKPSLEIFEVPFLAEIRQIEQLAADNESPLELKELVDRFAALAEKVLQELKHESRNGLI